MKSKFLLALLIAAGIILPEGLACAAGRQAQLPNSFVYQAISKYRNKNYTACIQDMDYAIKKGKAVDVAHYYKALSYAKLGMKEDAKGSYESALNSTSNKMIADFSRQAISCMNDASTCDSSLGEGDINVFIRSNKFMHSDVETAIKQKAMERVQESINNEIAPDEKDLRYINQNNQPTDKEIADAVRTFQKMGINPFGGNNNNLAMYGGQNSELMQLNSMFSNQGNNNNSMMNLIPMISAMQTSPNGADNNKQFIQAYMLNQMLPGFNFQNNDK